MTEKQRYLCHHAGVNYGPLTVAEIQAYVQSGGLPADTLVQIPQTGQWMPVNQFFAALQAGTAQPVQPAIVPTQQPVGQTISTSSSNKAMKRIGVIIMFGGLIGVFSAGLLGTLIMLPGAIICYSQGFYKQKKNIFAWMND